MTFVSYFWLRLHPKLVIKQPKLSYTAANRTRVTERCGDALSGLDFFEFRRLCRQPRLVAASVLYNAPESSPPISRAQLIPKPDSIFSVTVKSHILCCHAENSACLWNAVERASPPQIPGMPSPHPQIRKTLDLLQCSDSLMNGRAERVDFYSICEFP